MWSYIPTTVRYSLHQFGGGTDIGNLSLWKCYPIFRHPVTEMEELSKYIYSCVRDSGTYWLKFLLLLGFAVSDWACPLDSCLQDWQFCLCVHAHTGLSVTDTGVQWAVLALYKHAHTDRLLDSCSWLTVLYEHAHRQESSGRSHSVIMIDIQELCACSYRAKTTHWTPVSVCMLIQGCQLGRSRSCLIMHTITECRHRTTHWTPKPRTSRKINGITKLYINLLSCSMKCQIRPPITGYLGFTSHPNVVHFFNQDISSKYNNFFRKTLSFMLCFQAWGWWMYLVVGIPAAPSGPVWLLGSGFGWFFRLTIVSFVI